MSATGGVGEEGEDADGYVCDKDACNERFSSLSSLSAHHGSKHSTFCLRLSSTSSSSGASTGGILTGTPSSSLVTPQSIPQISPLTLPSLIRDDTPTPSRFLRDFERNSSFLNDFVPVDGEVSPRSLRLRYRRERQVESITSPPSTLSTAESMKTNPFAETFKRASERRVSKLKIHQPDPVEELDTNNDTESLNTPSVPLTASSDHPLAALYTPEKEVVDMTSVKSMEPDEQVVDPKTTSQEEPNIITQAFISAEISHQLTKSRTTIEEVAETDPPARIRSGGKQTIASTALIKTDKRLSIPPGSRLVQITPNTRILPKPSPQTPSTPAAIVDGVQVRLPDGSIAMFPPSPFVSGAMLSQNGSQATHISSTAISITPSSSFQPSTSASATASPSDPSSFSFAPRRSGKKAKPVNLEDLSTSQPKKRGRKSKEEKERMLQQLGEDSMSGEDIQDISESRKQEWKRELNKEAAQRCRMKRRLWIQELEDNVAKLTEKNSQLEKEVTFLHNQVKSLNTTLKAHSKCSVTLQQMKEVSGQSNPPRDQVYL